MRENSDLQLTNRVIPNHNRLASCNTCTRSAEDGGGQEQTRASSAGALGLLTRLVDLM